MHIQDEPKVIQGHHQRPSFLLTLPTLGMVPIEFVVAFCRLQMPVNCTSHSLIVTKCEIGEARNYAAKEVLKMSPRPKYLFFIGDDMIPPWDGLIKLWQEMENGNWDILAGLYYIKQKSLPVPIAWRDNIPGWLEPGRHYSLGESIWVDVCGMDFTLIKPEVFEKVKWPWFETGPGHLPELPAGLPETPMELSKGSTDSGLVPGGMEKITLYTEDVYFCRKCKLAGLNIGVHTGIKVSHLDVKTGEIY